MRAALLPALLALAACAPPRAGSLPTYKINVTDPAQRHRLLEGFEAVHGAWRYTARRFSLTLDTPPDRPLYLALDGALPRELPSAQLTIRLNGQPVATHPLNVPGPFALSLPLPNAALKDGAARLDFELDRDFEDRDTHARYGLILLSAALSNLDTAPAALAQLRARTRAAYDARRPAALDPAQDRALMNLYHQTPVWRSFFFHSIRVEKSPTDLWNMQQLLAEVRPDYILETGAFRGGSALVWANILNGLGLTESRVLTVDIANLTHEAALDPLWARYVEFYLGSSTDPALVAEFARRTRGKKVLVTLDSDHSAPHVLRELRMYAPLVSPGSYLVVEDTGMDGIPAYPDSFPGPLAAVTLFLDEGGRRDFTPDPARENLGITFNPGGWLRRK